MIVIRELKRFASLAGLGAVIGIMFGVPAKAEIVVGANFSLTGPAAVLGTSFQRVIPFLPTEIAGETVRYVVLDDGTDPSAAVRNVRKLVSEDHADILIGPTNAPAGYALAPVLSELEIPMISGTPIELFGDKAAWFGSTMTTHLEWVGEIVNHMKNHGIKKIAYIGYSDTFGDQLMAALKRLAPDAGIEILLDERFARSDTSVAGQVLRIIAAQPDAVFIGASASPAVLPNVALRDRGYTKPLYNSVVAVGPNFMRLGGTKVEGALAASFLIPVAGQLPDEHPSKKIATDFVERFEKANPKLEADGQNGEAYDAGIILKAIVPVALKQAKPGTKEFRQALRNALYDIRELPGSLGVYNFKAGQPYGLDSRGVVMVTVKDGKWIYIGQ
jgi:branched-chain amino acid transport system substrate-binding protein